MTSAATTHCRASRHRPAVADAADQRRYVRTGCPSRGYSWARHSVLERIEQTLSHWERDSWRVWEYRGIDDGVQMILSTRPKITPIVVAQRAKGRLLSHLHATLRAEPDSAPREIAL